MARFPSPKTSSLLYSRGVRWFLLSFVTLTLGIPLLIVGFFLIWILLAYQPTISQLNQAIAELQQNTIIQDYEEIAYTQIDSTEDRLIIPLNRINKNLVQSILAIEDSRFFHHLGFDPIRIMGAVFVNLSSGGYQQGASTLTQQLVKLLLLTPERTLERKIKELVMSIILDYHYSKQEILEFYLNTIYLGYGNYGVEQAANAYFQKPATNLTIAESAFLAGLIKKPEFYLRLPKELRKNPPKFFPKTVLHSAIARQRTVLRQLVQLRWLQPETYRKVIQSPLQVHIPNQPVLKAPYFVQQVRKQLKQKHRLSHVSSGGYRVQSTLHPKLQNWAEQLIREAANDPDASFEQAALVAIEPQSGAVRALVGGVDFWQSQFNRAVQAKRQPGSAFKTLVYAQAMEQGKKPYDSMIDEPLHFEWELEDGSLDTYDPRNFDRLFGAERELQNRRGEFYYEDYMTLSQAFEKSINTIAVQLLYETGIEEVLSTLSKMGILLDSEIGLCLALGCAEVSLLEITSSYQPFVNQGKFHTPYFIEKISNSQGQVLYQKRATEPRTIFNEETVLSMQTLLQNVILQGTGRRANWAKHFHWIGGKTGTTTDARDAWFIGVSPELVVGIWVGNDDNSPMLHESGGRTPARLWGKFMKEALEWLPSQKMPAPPSHQRFPTCAVSGLLATQHCPNVDYYPYTLDQQPYVFCHLHPGRPQQKVPEALEQRFAQELEAHFQTSDATLE